MNKRYLAYIALLAGWIIFCYWWYANRISHRLHDSREKSWPGFSEDIPYPLAFTWASDDPQSGVLFGELKAMIQEIDSTGDILLIRGFYFRDEADSVSQLLALAQKRIDRSLDYLPMDRKRILIEALQKEVNADVRANPFEAVAFEKVNTADVIQIKGDTIELCFPFKDSLILPPVSFDTLNAWSRNYTSARPGITHIVGTADGSGIVEPIDIALERALIIKEELIKSGWKEEEIQLSTGQRSQPLALRNRCVMVYFE